MSMKRIILEYISRHTPQNIIKRGERLYQHNAVSFIGYDSKKDLYKFKVKGSRFYNVDINNLNKKKLESKCNCPYNWGDVCKHQIAALFYLINNETEQLQNKKILPTRKKDEPVIIEDLKNLNNDKIDRLLSPDTDRANLINYEIHSFKITKNGYEVVVKSYEYWNKKKFNINFNFSGNKLKITSNDPAEVPSKSLRLPEYFVLNTLLNNPNFQDVLDDEALNIFKKSITVQFGLKSTDYFKYFIVQVKNGNFYAEKLPEAIGLLPINQSDDGFIKFIDSISTIAFEVALPDAKIRKNLKMPGFALTIEKGHSGSFINYVAIVGKPNKAMTKLSSRISVYEPDKDIDVKLDETQYKIVRMIDNMRTLLTGNGTFEDFFMLSQRVFKALLNENFVYLKGRQHFNWTMKNLTPANLSGQFVKPFLKIVEDGNFIKAEKWLKLGEKSIPFKKIDKKRSTDNIVVYDDTFYHYASYKDTYLIGSIPNDTRIVKTHKEFFYQKFIQPLSKEFEVVFDQKIFKSEDIALDFQKRQIFLSEKDDFILINLQVVYDQNKEVLLTTDGDFVHREDDKIYKYIRNKELENDFLEEIATLHPDFEEQKYNKFFYLYFEDFIQDMWFYKFFDYLKIHQIEIYGVKDLKKFKYSPHKAKVVTSVSSGQDWFDVNVDISFGDNMVSLKDIKTAIANKQRYIQLKDGSVGILPEEWLHKLEKYFRNAAEIDKNSLKISKMRFSVIDELFDEQDQMEILEELEEKKKRLKSFRKIDKVQVPAGIKAQLRDYQKEGLNWLNFLHEMQWGGILADDMGLGKTLQILTFLKRIVRNDKTPNLIVVPTTLLFNWQKEIEKFVPGLKAYYHYGKDRQRHTKGFKKYHLIFTTYGTMLRDIEFLKDFQFNYVILDESQAIKNPVSRRFKAVSLLKARNRIAMTGTPIENSTFDLYAQMSFVNPGFFIGVKNFKDHYSNPIDKDGDELVAQELQRLVNPFILRRTKEKVAKELPDKIEDIIYCEMSPAQRKVYDAYRNHYRDKVLKQIKKEGIAKSKFMVLEALTRLRQICDSPALLNDDAINTTDSVKIDEIVAHITDKTANHKLLIFSQFTSMLALLKERLDQLNISYAYLDGQTNIKQREAMVNRFQNEPDLRVFLISLKAGGTGLNLTAADYVYILDPWWNPAVENQAIDRIYRIGQTKNVFAYRMICKNTIEEKILDLQSKKRKIATDIIHTDESIMKALKTTDIQNLFD